MGHLELKTQDLPVPSLTLNQYQLAARETSLHKNPVIYPALGLAGEAGEVANKIKRAAGQSGILRTELLNLLELKDELGDVLWFISDLASDLGWTLNDIARDNLHKLHERQMAGTIWKREQPPEVVHVDSKDA